jgi:ADP-heptose:LPS heptosyltransferase
MKEIPGNINRILVIRIRPIGDTLLSTPVFRELKKTFSESSITVVVEEPFQEILRNNPNVDKVYTYKRKSSFSYLKLLLQLLFKNFDLAVDLKNTPRSATIALISGAKYRIGGKKPRNFFYSHKIDNSNPGSYTVYSLLGFLRPLGIESRDVSLDLVLSSDEKKFGEERWNEHFSLKGIRCLVYISGKYPTQRWPKEHFISLIKLLSTIPNIQLLIVGGMKEFELCREICILSDCGAKTCRDTSIRELAAVVSSASMMISADTGPRHFATAFNIPTVTLFTSTPKEVWNPPDLIRNPVVTAQGLNCLPCGSRWCENMRCLDELSPNDVFKEVRLLFQRVDLEMH